MSTLTDTERASIVALARDGLSRNEIARQTGRAASTVTKVCTDAGVTFDRSSTTQATQAKVVDAKAHRVELATGFLADLDFVRVQLRTAQTPRELADLARAIAQLTNAYTRILAIDPNNEDVDAAKSLLGEIYAGLTAAYGDLSALDSPDAGGSS